VVTGTANTVIDPDTDGAMTVTGGNITFTGDVEFGDDLTATAVNVTFAGEAEITGGLTTISPGNVTVSSGSLTVGGAANIAGALAGPIGGSAAFIFNGTTDIASYAAKAEASADIFAGAGDLTIATLTNPGEGFVTFNGTTTITSYTAKAEASADIFAGAGDLTIATLTHSGAAVVTFNGEDTTITGAIDVAAAGLKIAGEGTVTLEAAPDLSGGTLNIASTGGVYFADITTGSGSDTVQLTKAILIAGDAGNPIELTGSSGEGFTLGAGDVLVLADGGAIAVAGGGIIDVYDAVEISGDGATWTAGTENAETDFIVIHDDGEAPGVVTIGTYIYDSDTDEPESSETPGTLTTGGTGTAGTITVKAEKTLELENITLDLGTSSAGGSLVLTGHVSTGATLVAGGEVKAGTTTITGSWQVVGEDTVTIKADESTAGAGTAVLTGGNNAEINVTAGTFEVKGTIDISANGTITLTGDGGSPGVLLLKGDATVPGALKTGTDVTTPIDNASVSKSDFVLYPSDGDDSSNNKVTVSKNGDDPVDSIVLLGDADDASDGLPLGLIGGGGTADDNDVLITGQTIADNFSAITKGWVVKVPND
jgi:filamentous hemagglutinin